MSASEKKTVSGKTERQSFFSTLTRQDQVQLECLCSIMFMVAVTHETVYGTKHVRIIFVQHSVVMFPEIIRLPWLINARIMPTIMATFAALKATGLLKNMGSAIFKLFIKTPNCFRYVRCNVKFLFARFRQRKNVTFLNLFCKQNGQN